MKATKLFVPLAVALLSLFPALGQFDFGLGGDASGSDLKVKGELLSEVEAFQPGEPFDVALRLDHKPGWHTYYRNPGITGKPPELKWSLPEGWSAAEPRFPLPERLNSQGATTYSYGKTVYLFIQLTPPADLGEGEKVEIGLKANWQACDDSSCIFQPGPSPADFFDFSLTLEAATGEKASDAAAALARAKQKLPGASRSWQVEARNKGRELVLDFNRTDAVGSEVDDAYFFASAPGVIDSDAPQKLEKTASGFRLTLTKTDDAGKIESLDGILSVAGQDISAADGGAILVEGLQADAAPASELYEDLAIGPLLLVILGMLVGGVILNLMPCVFPVIGLKIMGFVNQAGEDRKKIVVHGLVFTAGVLISFWVLSGLLLALRQQALKGGGAEVGWGYQLQNPYVVWGLLLVMFILGLNMFGLFEIGARATSVGGKLQSKQGVSGSFFSGVLATVVATPCSAPFLGAAIGAAFGLPPFKFMLAFTAMAVGLALPYLVLSVFPGLVKKLPRPGPWMESFKQGMSFLLFGTAGYLLWVYLSQNSSFHGLWIFIGLSVIGAAAWVYGRWLTPGRSSRQRWIGGVVALVLLGSGLFASRPVAQTSITWQAWSQAAVDDALEAGRPVYVDFTAKWCLTCQANKSRAYPPEVAVAFADRNVLMLKADKTNPSPEIEKALKRLGRSAIPVNVLYVPGQEPVITPEILGPDYLRELLEEKLPLEE